MVDEKQKRAIERARKTAERQRKLMSKRKESQEEFSRSMSSSSTGDGMTNETTKPSKSMNESLEVGKGLKEIQEDEEVNSIDDGRANAVIGGKSLEMGDESVDGGRNNDESDIMSRSESAPAGVGSISSSKSNLKSLSLHEAASTTSSTVTSKKSVDIPRLHLQEGSVDSLGVGSASASLQQNSVASVAGSKKSHGSTRSVSFQDNAK
jgi:hypothetical protein